MHCGLEVYKLTNLSHDRLPSRLRTDSTDFMVGPFLLSISVFVSSFFITLFLFGSMRHIKLAIRQLLGAHKYSVSYRISNVVESTAVECKPEFKNMT